jgi:hypothetical protein
MFEVGQQVTVITDKGIGYNCYILVRAGGDNGIKAYKVSSDEGGMGHRWANGTKRPTSSS